MIRYISSVLVTAGLVFLFAPADLRAAPAVANLAPRGLRIGQPTTLVITGSGLSAETKFILPVKIASQAIKGEPKADRVEIEVALDAGVQPGIYPLRVANGSGISRPVLIAIDKLPQVPFAAIAPELPVAMHGTVGGAQVLQLKLAGRKDQRLVIDLETQRLGGGLKPVVRLYDPRGTQIAWSPPRSILGGDARLETVLPADAEYTVELHDQIYRPAGPGFFRLKMGDLQYADLALPLGASTGSKQSIQFASSNIAAAAQTDATTQSVPGETAATVPDSPAFTGAAPRLVLSDFSELVEAPKAADGQMQILPLAPAAISGTLAATGEEDVFALTVSPAQKLRFNVTARQFGSPVDAVLSIRNE